MLTDTSEKSKNPLKKAMRRRNAKAVQFTAQTSWTMIDASDIDYSSDEDEEGDNDFFGQDDDNDNSQAQNQDNSQEDDRSAGVEPLKPRGQVRQIRPSGDSSMEPEAREANGNTNVTADGSQGRADGYEPLGRLSRWFSSYCC